MFIEFYKFIIISPCFFTAHKHQIRVGAGAGQTEQHSDNPGPNSTVPLSNDENSKGGYPILQKLH